MLILEDCWFVQGFKRQLEELESMETIRPKIAEKNNCIRKIQQDIGDISEQQRDLNNEKHQHTDRIR